MRTKRLALVPRVRRERCNHEHVPFRGDVPCTGPRICTMCGATQEEIDQERHVEIMLATTAAYLLREQQEEAPS